MKTFFGTVFRFIFLILFLLFAFAGIDYYRMTEGYLPVFSIPSYNSKTRVQTFKGTFYTADRTVRASVSESIGESSNFHYRLFQFPISIEVPKSKTTDLFDIDGKKSDVCGESQLVYADKERKIYLFCLDDLQIRFGNDQNDINSLIKKF